MTSYFEGIMCFEELWEKELSGDNLTCRGS